jgi:hypothetical protein
MLRKIAYATATRRGFVKEIAPGTAGIAVASALWAAMDPVDDRVFAEPMPVAQVRAKELKYRKLFTSELTPDKDVFIILNARLGMGREAAEENASRCEVRILCSF